MSGPKKADVVAALDVARRMQQNCASLISRTETAAVRGVLSEADRAAGAAAREAQTARGEAETLRSEAGTLASDAVEAARSSAARAEQAVAGARQAVERSTGALQAAEHSEATARSHFQRAEATYQQAASALRASGGHFLSTEMAGAREAQRLYDAAAGEMRDAAARRKEAQRAASAAAAAAGEAHAAALAARDAVRGARAEVEAHRRAENEARRIAEEARRRTVIALEEARGAVAALRTLPHEQFAPGAVEKAEAALVEAARAGEAGSHAAAERAARTVAGTVRTVAARVADDAREHARRRAEAEARIAALAAAVENADAEFLAAWSPRPEVLGEARAALKTARTALSRDAFDGAGQDADTATDALLDALRAAAEAQGLDERRACLGEAIMDTLEELGFEVSYEPGTRTDPLRISGQTPDASGRGDFDVALPLEGEVDFHVEAAEGDVSCVAAVEALRARLAKRGFDWQTTDWGHAAGHGPVRAVRQATEVQQQKTKART